MSESSAEANPVGAVVERRITLFSREGCTPCRLVKPLFLNCAGSKTVAGLGATIPFEVVEATVEGDDDDDASGDHDVALDPSVSGYPTVALTDVSVDSNNVVVRRRVSRDKDRKPLAALMGGSAIAKGLREWVSSTIGSFARPDFDAAVAATF